ncbi:MAG: T9SS type A sorting domain-containing protein [Flavobacteriales bacterium]
MKHFYFKSAILAVAFFSFTTISPAQFQTGDDIDGESTSDRSGSAISMPNSTTIAIGAPRNDGNGGNAGHVRIFSYNGSSWTQKGADLDGDAAGDLFGSTVSMPDENTLAVGAPENNENGTVAGMVKVFEWNGTEWSQKGQSLLGDVPSEFFGDIFGSSVSMPDANTIAVGAPWNNANGFRAGQVKIFDWDGNAWNQRGDDIYDGPATYSGSVVSMPSIDVVAIASQGGSAGLGHVRIFEWNGAEWIQKGENITGETTGDLSGDAISMPDENTIAIGTENNDGGAPDAGHVRIFEWSGSEWVQKGAAINGELEGDKSGNSVSMPDANTVAIGSSLNDDNGLQSGHARVFIWNGSEWQQQGATMIGEATQDQFGYSVSMPDASTVAVGALQNDGNGNEAGHVRVFGLSEVSVVSSSVTGNDVLCYPNPANEMVTIAFNAFENVSLVQIISLDGKVLKETNNIMGSKLNLELPFPAGMYLIKIETDSGSNFISLMKY